MNRTDLHEAINYLRERFGKFPKCTPVQLSLDALSDGLSAMPDWHMDGPTCAGLWVFPGRDPYSGTCVNLDAAEIARQFWQRPCFGPIPQQPTKEPPT